MRDGTRRESGSNRSAPPPPSACSSSARCCSEHVHRDTLVGVHASLERRRGLAIFVRSVRIEEEPDRHRVRRLANRLDQRVARDFPLRGPALPTSARSAEASAAVLARREARRKTRVHDELEHRRIAAFGLGGPTGAGGIAERTHLFRRQIDEAAVVSVVAAGPAAAAAVRAAPEIDRGANRRCSWRRYQWALPLAALSEAAAVVVLGAARRAHDGERNDEPRRDVFQHGDDLGQTNRETLITIDLFRCHIAVRSNESPGMAVKTTLSVQKEIESRTRASLSSRSTARER